MTSADSTWKARPDGEDYASVRQRLVDAAEMLIREGGLGALRQDAVAERAGLHRSSVYRYFDSKQDLVTATVVQSTLRIGHTIQQALGPAADPAEFVVSGMVEALDAMAADPLHQALTAPGSSRAMTRVAHQALRDGVRPLLESVFGDAAGRAVLREGVTADDAVRWLEVVALGLTQAPNVVRDADELRDLLTTMLVPALLAH